jgi:transglutaminase-like putative cysteine protease
VSRIKEVQNTMMQGVLTRRYLVETTLKEMGIVTTSVLKDDGDVLESQIGGGFTMRLEDEPTAKNIDYRSDVLLSTVIKPEKPIKNPAAVREMRVKLSGVKDRELLISSERQTYSVQPNGEALLVVRVEDLAGIKAPDIPMPREKFPLDLGPSLFIQSDSPELVARAKEVVGGERNALKASDRIVRWVHDTLKKRFSATFSNALDVLAAGGGDCTEHSVLYVALARAAGLPAREVSGIMYCGEDDAFYYHQWAEAFVGKWIAVDPTFGQAQADATHIMFASGDILSQARLLSLIGALKIEVIDYRYDRD